MTSPTVELLLLLLGVERAPLCASVARFVYWNRLFVFDPDGTLSTPVDFVPFTRDRFTRSPFRKNGIFLFFLSFFLLSFFFSSSSSIATTIEQLESVRDRSSTEKFARNRGDRELSAFLFIFSLFFPFLFFSSSFQRLTDRARRFEHVPGEGTCLNSRMDTDRGIE